MSNAREFLVKIVTTADATGAVQTKAELVGVADATGKVSATTKGLAEAHGQAEKAAEHSLVPHRELHKLFHGLNELLPGLGTLAYGAISPIGAAIMVAVAAAQTFHERMKELNEEFRKQEEEMAKPYTHTLQAQREEMVAAAKSAEDFKDRLEDAARGEESLKAAMEQQTQVARAAAQADGARQEALKTLAGVQLDWAHKEGLVSDAQFYQAKLALEEDYAEKKRAIEEKIAAAELEARRSNLGQAKQQQAGLEAEAEAAVKRTEKVRIKLGGLPSEEEVRTNKDTADKALKEFTDQHGESSQFFQRLGVNLNERQAHEAIANAAFPGAGQAAYDFGGENVDQATDAYAEWARLRSNADRAGLAFRQRPRAAARLQSDLTRAEHAQERAERRAEQNQGFITDEGRQTKLLGDSYNQRLRTDADLNRIGRGNVSAESALNSPAGLLLGQAAAGEAAIQHGHAANAAQLSAIQAVTNLLQANNQNSEAILQALGGAAGNIAALAAKIQQVEQSVGRSLLIP